MADATPQAFLATPQALFATPQALLLDAIAWLDAMPDGARAALAAGFLMVFLRYFETRIPTFEIQYGQSFRKTALVALVLIPAFVWLVPASRMTVYVEALEPATDSVHLFWFSLLGLWLAGLLVSLTALTRAQLVLRTELNGLQTIDDEKLLSRLAHWQRRLGVGGGVDDDISLLEVPGSEPRFLTAGRHVAFPAAARHWPGNQQDVLLIISLAHLKRRHRRWHGIGWLVSCLYWPVPWVQKLSGNLIRDFQQSADKLAESCYQDRLGYDRALRQLAQRLEPPRRGRSATATQGNGSAPDLKSRLTSALQDYATALKRLLTPAVEPDWELADLLSERSADHRLTWTDPYDRVVLFVGQAAFLAFLLTGTTLEERPPEIDYEYSFPFELLWKEHFHRNQELEEMVQPAPPS